MKPLPYVGKIGTNGLYAMSIDEYHSDCCSGPSISSSGLRTIEAKTAAHYWATSYLNPDRIEQDAKEAFDFGRAAHTLLLGESGFREQYAVRPEQFSDWRTSAARAWRSEQQDAGRTVLTSEQIGAIRGMSASLGAHPLAKDLLQGRVEQSLIFKDEKTGVWLKSRPDVLPVADGVVVDLKTTTDASPDAVRRAIVNYAYAMQGAMVGKALKQVLNVDMTAFALIFIEKAAPYAISVIEVDLDWIAYARRQLRRAIDTFARCVEANEWPGYSGEQVVHMPDWMRKRMDEESDVGLLPSEEEAA